MSYIGREPLIGNFVKLDAISVVNGQAAYTMNNGGSAFTDYESVNQFLVSLNGTIQAPTDSFTVSGSTLTFASNLSTGDVIDFIIVFGNSLSAGTPTDDTVTAAKLNDDIISGQTALASEPADTDEFLVSDAGTLKRIDYSLIKGGGKINQALQMEYGSHEAFTASAGTFTDTSVTLNITPSATSSKIVGWAFWNCGNSGDYYMYLRVSRTAPSSAVVGNKVGHTPQSGAALIDAGSLHFIDSPNTTSQCTYTLQLDAGGGTGRLNARGDDTSGPGTSGIMLMEVLA